jgi:hypothetical protein
MTSRDHNIYQDRNRNGKWHLKYPDLLHTALVERSPINGEGSFKVDPSTQDELKVPLTLTLSRKGRGK